MIDDELLVSAVYRVIAPTVFRARQRGPLPMLRSQEYLDAPHDVQAAVLLLAGSQWVFGDPALRLTREVSRQVHGGDTGFWSALAERQRTHPREVVESRRREPITPVRCTRGGCRSVVSVPHPLPDLRTVRCTMHAAEIVHRRPA